VESVGKESSSLLLQFPAEKSLFTVNWIGVLSKEKKVSFLFLLVRGLANQQAHWPILSLLVCGSEKL
jgi:hypothetical protein